MFKEMKGLEYTLEILRVLHHNPGKHDSKTIYDCMRQREEISLSYVQKILPRISKIGLLFSSEAGYSLAKPIDEITVSQVLNLCDMPMQTNPLYKLCDELKKAVSLTCIEEFYDFKP
jgi:DNA-binding IscR family transcriptional regulator